MTQSRVHLHVENLSGLGRVFEADRKRVREALARRPSLQGRVRTSIGYDGDILEKRLKTADVVFAWDIPRPDLARRAPRLKWMHAHGAGVNHLMPLDWLPPGAVLTNSRGVHGRRATEYAAMALLMLNNRVPEMVTNQRKGRWRQCFNSNIGGKTLLIVGVGHIGGAVAKWAKGMDMHVIGVRRSGRRHRHADEMHTPDALPALLPRADFVLMSAPAHRREPPHDRREGARAHEAGRGLVNYSRANCVDYDALVEKLERGEMSAVLDVFDPEPLPAAAPLCGRRRTSFITPHCSSDDSDYYTPRTLDLVLEKHRAPPRGQAAQEPGAARVAVLKGGGGTPARRGGGAVLAGSDWRDARSAPAPTNREIVQIESRSARISASVCSGRPTENRMQPSSPRLS